MGAVVAQVNLLTKTTTIHTRAAGVDQERLTFDEEIGEILPHFNRRPSHV